MIKKTIQLLEKDLSNFSDDDLRVTRRWLLRKPWKFWLWGDIIPAVIAINTELEFRAVYR